MIEKVKIRIEEDEWAEASLQTRTRIIELMQEYGYDTKMLEVLNRDLHEPTVDDIYRQFYGDED